VRDVPAETWQVSWLAGQHLRPAFPPKLPAVARFWTQIRRLQLRGQPRIRTGFPLRLRLSPAHHSRGKI